jgi:CO/xanthine dehydrogenase FAD-binding subunit
MLWPFEYHSPAKREEITRILEEHEDAGILAGGTDLLVEMRSGARRPGPLVDLRKVEGLDGLRLGPEAPSFVGSRVTLSRILESPPPWACLSRAIEVLATHQIRNLATLTGNLCNASPAADCAPPLLVLGAGVRVFSGGGERVIPLEDFFRGVKQSALERGEWVLGVEIPAHPASVRTAFMKKRRIRGHDLALVNAAGLLDPESRKLRLAVGACAPTPLLFNLDGVLAKASSADELAAAAWNEVSAGLRPISDCRCCSDYRTDMTRLFVHQIIHEIYG